MNCSRCGSQIPEENPACPNCGLPRFAQTQTPPPPPPKPAASYLPPPSPSAPEPVRNYLVWAIVITICCCQPLGIVAIVFAVLAMTKQQSGDLRAAREMAGRARLFCLLGFFIGLAGWLIFVLVHGTASFFEFFERTAG